MANKTELVILSDGKQLKADPLKFMREFDNTLVMPVYASLIDEGKSDPTLTEDEALDTAATTWKDIDPDTVWDILDKTVEEFTP